MNPAPSYAKALYALVEADSSKAHTYIQNLRQALARRGHSKLMPHILSEYQKLELQHARAAEHARITPERERTRVLLDLYKHLISTR